MPTAEIPTGDARRRAAALAGHDADPVAARAFTADVEPKVRATAYAALGRLGALVPADFIAALSDADPYVRRRAATLSATATDRDAVAPVLLARLHDEDHLVGEAAAWALGEWSETNPLLGETVTVLSTMATDHEEPLCREAAAAALGAIGDERGLPAILRACTDKPAVRRRAVLALAPFEGPEVEAAIDTALTDRDWQVRQAAEDLRR